MTLAERSEMQFTEFLLTPQQRRTIVSLTLGKLRVVTTRIFGSGSSRRSAPLTRWPVCAARPLLSGLFLPKRLRWPYLTVW